MPRLLLTTLERREAAQAQALARGLLAQARRHLQSPTLAPLAKEQLAADIDDLEREADMLGTLLAADRPRWTMARYAGPDDSPEERPYQEAVVR